MSPETFTCSEVGFWWVTSTLGTGPVAGGVTAAGGLDGPTAPGVVLPVAWVAWAVVSGSAPPPAAESKVSWSTFQPLQSARAWQWTVVVWAAAEVVRAAWWATWVSTTWGPADRVRPAAEAPQATTETWPLARAAAVEPTIFTVTGCPSMLIRLDWQVPGSWLGKAGTSRPGMPSSARPSGRAMGDWAE